MWKISSLFPVYELKRRPANVQPSWFSITTGRQSAQPQFRSPEPTTGQVHSSSQLHQSSPGSLSTLGVRPVEVLPVHPNPLRGVRVGEQRSDLPPPPPLPQPPSQPLLRLPPPAPPSCQVDDERQVHQQLPAAFHPTTLLGQPNPPTQPLQQPHSDTLDPVDVGSIPDPAEDGKMSVTNIRAAMGLDKSPIHMEYYLVIRVGTLLYILSPTNDLLSFQRVVRGWMAEDWWDNWSSVPEVWKRWLYTHVSRPVIHRYDLTHILNTRQVYNDPRIPIIKRYANNWATREIARTVALSRRKYKYACGLATPPPRYFYNRGNSAKRDPKAPRGRWNSVTGSVQHEGRAARHTQLFQGAGAISPDPTHPDASDVQFDLGLHDTDARNVNMRDLGECRLDTPAPSPHEPRESLSSSQMGVDTIGSSPGMWQFVTGSGC